MGINASLQKSLLASDTSFAPFLAKAVPCNHTAAKISSPIIDAMMKTI
jgi:hypothetical protein